jgi:hypothetical protein
MWQEDSPHIYCSSFPTHSLATPHTQIGYDIPTTESLFAGLGTVDCYEPSAGFSADVGNTTAPIVFMSCTVGASKCICTSTGHTAALR